MILTNAQILTWDDSNRVLPSGSVEILNNGTLGFVCSKRVRSPDAVDLGGRLVMPALINCHTHLYSTFARGFVFSSRPPSDFRQILKKIWWRLDRALKPEDVYYSALAGLIESAKCGVGTVIDHHSSPSACPGSLDQIEHAFRKVGLRGATCYETSDRNGGASAREAIRENVRFIERSRRGGTIGAGFGLHAAFTLSDRTLRACAEANQSLQAPFHIHVAEDVCDRGAAERLDALGILTSRTLAAHCVHVRAAERATLARRGVNVVVNPQSNCNNAVGPADLEDLARRRILVGLGSDGYTPRIGDEFRTSLLLEKLRSRDPWCGPITAFGNNRTIVKKLWGFDVGRIQTGAAADLAVLDYYPPTPLMTGNAMGHLLFGIAYAPVDSLIVNGRYVIREKHMVGLDERHIMQRAAAHAKALWERL